MASIIFDSEKELEDLIMANIESNFHSPFTDDVVHKVIQQVSLDSYGVADLITFKCTIKNDNRPHFEIDVIEVKKQKINKDTLAQVARYMAGVEHLFLGWENLDSFSVTGTVVAPSVSMNDDTVFLCDAIDRIRLFTADFNPLKGIDFNEHSGWHRSGASLESGCDLFSAADEAQGLVRELMLDRIIDEEIERARDRSKKTIKEQK